MFSQIKVPLVISLVCFGFSAYSQTQNPTGFLENQTNKTNPLFGYLVGPNTEKLNKPVLRPFSTDGCSQSPNSVNGVEIVECCVKHDIAYWLGGTKEEKEASDIQLGQCISDKTGNPIAGQVYLSGVGVGGSAKLPNTFRWGYGWDALRTYQPLSADDIGQAERMYGKNIERLKRMVDEKKYVINFELLTFDLASLNRFNDDLIVYYFLQNNLKRQDVVSYGQKLDLTSLSLRYVVGLSSCGNNVIKIQLDQFQLWKDLFKLNKDIHTMPWSQLQKYVLSVQDDGKCL